METVGASARLLSSRSQRLVRTLYRLRTEAGSPARQACSIALGLFIGATPLFGLHLAMAIGLGWLLRLNRLKVYLAANISNPFVAPFLVTAELQVGSWLRRGRFYTPSGLADVRLLGVTSDLAIGSVVVGCVLALAGGLLTYGVLANRPTRALQHVLDAAAERFLPVGIAAWEFASAKLRMDPVYQTVLEDGVLPGRGTILDLGCGQGLMLALLASARDLGGTDRWPADWPSPPRDVRLLGIELGPRIASRARRALAGAAEIDTRDVLQADLPPSDAVLVFDVLHMLPPDAQVRLLDRIAAALRPGGVVVLREADAAGGWRLQVVRWTNWLRAAFEGHPGRRFAFRTADEWTTLLRRRGLAVERSKSSSGSTRGLANFLIYGRRAAVPASPD